MIDLAYEALDGMVLAQASTTSSQVQVAPEPNWATKYPELLEGVRSLLKNPKGYIKFSKPEYAPEGPLGIPTLKFILPGVEYSPRVSDDGKVRAEEQGLAPALSACELMDLQAGQVGAWGPECRIVKFLKEPDGKLVPDAREGARYGDYLYTPLKAGVDTMRFIVENGAGKQVDVTVVIPVRLDLPQAGASTSPATSFRLTTEHGQVIISTGELFGAALAETVNEGAVATITIDVGAAGRGWFVDPTPDDNEEFLATSSPNEWVAKEGGDAYGKMDLLTVLLHEYGHLLGLEHSADAHDYMATSLQPGVRRTLSVDQQLDLMQLVGYFPIPHSPSYPYGPCDPGAPLPFTRTTGNTRLARLRDARFAAWSDVPQFAILANPKLTNTEFNSDASWSTTGNVSFGNGSAVLKEAATAQTRLNQVFVVGEHDRFLSFTLDGIALDDVAAGPDDAFEVALLDANTGASLLGGTGLSRSDAFLNLQANGSEHAAASVSRIANADGSRTYLVDLGSVAAGTVANLSFDLIGFADTGSQISVRDLRIGVPQTKDDSVTLAEDTPTDIAALANDLNAQQPGFVPVVVSAPTHGQVAIDADGTFRFAPDQDWYGDDTFTYKLSDGKVDSNVATVSVTVTATATIRRRCSKGEIN